MRVVMVEEQDVDAVGAQPFQARLDCAAHMAAIRAARIDIFPGGVEAFGRDDQVVAVPADQLAEDLFGLAGVVLVGGIDEIDAGVTRGAVHARRLGGVGIAAERHRAEAELGNLDTGAAEREVVHVAKFTGPASLTAVKNRRVPRAR